MKVLKDAYEAAKRLLSENRDAMDQIAAFLIEKETITGKEFMKIFREVKGIPEPEEKKEEENGLPDTEHLKGQSEAEEGAGDIQAAAQPEDEAENAGPEETDLPE